VTGSGEQPEPRRRLPITGWPHGAHGDGEHFDGNIDTASLNPGSFTVTGHVSEGTKPGHSPMHGGTDGEELTADHKLRSIRRVFSRARPR